MFLIDLRFNMVILVTFGENFAEPVACLFIARLGELSNSPQRVDLHRSRGEQPNSPQRVVLDHSRGEQSHSP